LQKKEEREYHSGKHKQGTTTSKRGTTMRSRDASGGNNMGGQRYLLQKSRNNKWGAGMWNNKWGVGNMDVQWQHGVVASREPRKGAAKQVGSHAKEQQAGSNDLEQ
jgi:hypothetical protein